MRPFLRASLLSLLVAASGCPEPSPTSPDPVQPEVDAPPTRDEIVLAADARVWDEVLDRARRGPAAETRRAAMVALARLHNPDATDALRAGLRDLDPRVRDAASLGLGALEADRAGNTRAVAGALAVEPDASVRAAMLRDLGRLHDRAGTRVIVESLSSEAPTDRAAACIALAEIGLAGDAVSLPVQAQVAGWLDASQPVEVRRAAAYALGRMPPTTDAQGSQGIVVALGLAAADADVDVRAFAYRALGRLEGADPAVAAHGMQDPAWRVAVQAASTLGRLAARSERGPRLLAQALSTTAEGIDLESPRLHVLMAGLRAAAPHARVGPVHDVAAALHSTLANGEATRARGLAHCAAAELVDRGRGWPSRLERCGLEHVERWESQVQEARVLGDLDGATEQRLVRLRRLFSVERPAVKEATLSAASRIAHSEATDLVIRGLAIDDAGVRATALEALATIARRVPSADLAPPPLPVEAALAGLETAIEAAAENELETMVTWLDAAEATEARSLTEHVHRLAAHPSEGVRTRARALLAAWEVEPTDDAPGEVPHRVQTLLDPASRPHVRLSTRHGDIELELRPDRAPTTVARFLELVEAGFYDGLTFHRVVPGFVAQGGDPRGDGYGGPDFWQRCEDNRLPYERGTVGMALAGRDTGGSQFFIAHGPTPHLELRYTAFAQVVSGMEIVDRLLPRDVIERAVRESP
ncbi:MAG: peptidylprolyl isomerase [Sandaracinaceae bacterium]